MVSQRSAVATLAIGVIGYETDFAILDLLGLTDPVIARNTDVVRGPIYRGQGHLRSNASYVIDRRPAVIQIARDPGPEGRSRAAVRALWEHPEFHRTYVWDAQLGAYRLRRGGPGSDVPPRKARGNSP